MPRAAFPLLLLFPLASMAQTGKAWEKVQAQYAKGRIYAGIRTCDKQLSGKDPQHVFLVPRAEGHNRIAAYDKALRDAREALKHVQGDLAHAAALQLGIAMQQLGQPDSARHWLGRAMGGANDTEAHFRLGVLDLAQRQPADALLHFDQVLEKAPQHVAALRERGGAHAVLGDTAAARRDIEQALELAPRDPASWNSRGYHVHATNGRHREAITDFNRAIKLDPNYSFAFNNRGWSLYQLGDRDGAVRSITMAGRKNRSNSYVYRNLGIIALDAGEKERACNHFRLALELRYTTTHGNEVEELVRTHCGDLRPTVPAAPPRPAPGTADPDRRSNAPVRSNAP
jgi:tetratricopeptide (TPR) repeat protein